jgi:DNA-binding CsgD family transcriptional regulator
MNNIDSFSEREQEVIDLLVQGKSNKQIALHLKISNRTVEFHLSNIYSKLNVSSRTEAVLLLMKDVPVATQEEPVGIPWRESTVLPNDQSPYNGEKGEKLRRTS